MWKKIVKILLLFVLLVVLAGVLLTIIYGKDIERMVFAKIKEKSLARIEAKEVRFSVFQKFPYASVLLTDLVVYEQAPNEKDTLLYSGKVFLQFNIYDLFSEKQYISKINLQKSVVNIRYDQEGNPNFKIFKEQDKKSKWSIGEVKLEQSELQYQDLRKEVNIAGHIKTASLQFNAPDFSAFSVNGEFLTKQLYIGTTNYIQQKQMQLEGDFLFANDTFFIHRSDWELETIKIALEGKTKGSHIALAFSGEDQNLEEVLMHMPERFKKVCSFFAADGTITCNGNIEGIISDSTNPHVDMHFQINNGKFDLLDNPLLLTEVDLSGNLNNGKENNFSNTRINVVQAKAKDRNSSFSGSFSVSNLNHYYLITDIKSHLMLQELNSYFTTSPFSKISGTIDATTKYKGRLDFSSAMENHFLRSQHESKLSLNQVQFQYEDFPLTFGISKMLGTMKNNKIEVNESNFTIAESDFAFQGNIVDFVAYLFSASPNIIVSGSCQSQFVRFDQLITLKDISDEQEAEGTTLPNWIEVDLNTQIQKLKYENFEIKDLQTNLEYNQYTLKAQKTKMKTLQGLADGDFKFFEKPKNRLNLIVSTHLDKINIPQLFYSFRDFGQEFIQGKHIKGIGTSDIQLQVAWNDQFEFDPGSLQLNSHVKIEKGELIDFAPLENLSSYVSLDELRHVKFSTLENNIRISDQLIRIPSMEIQSSAMNLFISGTHSFNNDMDYHIRVLLSELISNKFKQKNKKNQQEFGTIEDDGLGRVAIYLKMTGNVDDPDVSFDKIKAAEKIKSEVSKEKQEITTIIKEDVLQKKTENMPKKETEQQKPAVILEWEDEN